MGAGTANAVPCRTEAEQDETFSQLLSSDGTLFNFNLQKMQAKRACDREAYGLDAVQLLMRDGGYSFDVANSIVSAGSVAYCPQHNDRVDLPPYPFVNCPPTPTS